MKKYGEGIWNIPRLLRKASSHFAQGKPLGSRYSGYKKTIYHSNCSDFGMFADNSRRLLDGVLLSDTSQEDGRPAVRGEENISS